VNGSTTGVTEMAKPDYTPPQDLSNPSTIDKLTHAGIDMSWYDKAQKPEDVEAILTGTDNSGIHKHTLKRAYKRTRNVNGPAFILSWICVGCPFRQAFDLTHDEPVKK
jgi:hypothetical protein